MAIIVKIIEVSKHLPCKQSPREPLFQELFIFVYCKKPPTQYEGDHCLGDYPPHLILSKLNHTVNKGENITFECTFFGNPLPQVEWESNGKDTKVTMCINKAASQITSRLHVRNVDWVNRGTVRCVASTRHGKASGSGMLNVYGW